MMSVKFKYNKWQLIGCSYSPLELSITFPPQSLLDHFGQKAEAKVKLMENLYSVMAYSLIKVNFMVGVSSLDAQCLNPQLVYPLLAYSLQALVQMLRPPKIIDFNSQYFDRYFIVAIEHFTFPLNLLQDSPQLLLRMQHLLHCLILHFVELRRAEVIVKYHPSSYYQLHTSG